MASYTANYQLHQWEPADFFLRTDFNADFAKLDAALAGKAGLADLAEKLGAVTGSYTGDGSANRTITLGAAPVAVFLREDEDSGAILAVQNGAVMDEEGEVTMLTVSGQGFQVTYDAYFTGVSNKVREPYANRAGVTYRYLALKL